MDDFEFDQLETDNETTAEEELYSAIEVAIEPDCETDAIEKTDSELSKSDRRERRRRLKMEASTKSTMSAFSVIIGGFIVLAELKIFGDFYAGKAALDWQLMLETLCYMLAGSFALHFLHSWIYFGTVYIVSSVTFLLERDVRLLVLSVILAFVYLIRSHRVAHLVAGYTMASYVFKEIFTQLAAAPDQMALEDKLLWGAIYVCLHIITVGVSLMEPLIVLRVGTSYFGTWAIMFALYRVMRRPVKLIRPDIEYLVAFHLAGLPLFAYGMFIQQRILQFGDDSQKKLTSLHKELRR